MSRQKKDGKYLNVYLDKLIYDALEKFCQESGQSKTIAVERAIQKYIEDKKEK